MIAALLLTLAAPQDGCVAFPENWSWDDPTLLQKSGDGLWIGGIAFTPGDIEVATPIRDALTEEWALLIRFTSGGNAKFVEAQRCGVGRPIEISLDRKLLSRPTRNEPVTGGAAQINGGWSDRAEVEAVARRIAGS